jgi:glycosyltransferase involved in cell wall biosynthesis
MSRPRVLIDLVPIRPGKGGTGSGVWTHALRLVQELDKSDASTQLDIRVLINPEQRAHFATLKNVRKHRFGGTEGSAVLRLLWIHFALPLVCLWFRAKALHKVATETPLWCPAHRITTVHDFFGEVMHESGVGRQGLSDRYFAWITRICFARSKAIITVSEAVKDEAQKRFPRTPARITAIHNGADLPERMKREPREDEDFHRLILCVAKLMPYKGQMEAIEALERLYALHPEWKRRAKLILHGFNNDEAYFQALNARMMQGEVHGCVGIRGYGQYTLAEIYESADVFLFLTRYEGFGLPVVESQALGIPVICSDIPVLREVGGDGAIYVDRNDPDAIAAQLHALMSDEDMRASLVRNGTANVQRFSWRTMAERTAQVYREVCA